MTTIPITSTMTYAKWPREESMVPLAVANDSLADQEAFIDSPDRTTDELLTYLTSSRQVAEDFGRWIGSEKDVVEGEDVEKMRALAKVHLAMSAALIKNRPIQVERAKHDPLTFIPHDGK